MKIIQCKRDIYKKSEDENMPDILAFKKGNLYVLGELGKSFSTIDEDEKEFFIESIEDEWFKRNFKLT